MPVVLPDLELCRVAHTATVVIEALHSFRWLLRDASLRRQLGADVQISFAVASQFTAGDYIQAQCIRRRMAAHFDAAFRAVDVLVTPTVAVAAPPRVAAALERGESNLTVVGALMKYVQLSNLLGAPAVAVPAGVNAAGLPVRCSCSFATEFHHHLECCDLLNRIRLRSGW